MSAFDTAVRGGLRFKRHSEALVADEKRRKKKKRARENKQEDTPPTVVELPPELADDPGALAAAAAIQAGKTTKEALIANEQITTEAQPDPEASGAAAGATAKEDKSEKVPKEGRGSASPELWRAQESGITLSKFVSFRCRAAPRYPLFFLSPRARSFHSSLYATLYVYKRNYL